MSFIGDDIGMVVQAMRNGGSYAPYEEDIITVAPYFMYGHRLEIANRTTLKEENSTKKTQIFPLIALRQDIAETTKGNVIDYDLNLVIATYTDQNYNADERQAKIIGPILEPLYLKFLRFFKESGFFMWGGKLNQVSPPHVKINRPFYGTPSQNENVANLFNDPTDAIELVNFKFSKIIKTC